MYTVHDAIILYRSANVLCITSAFCSYLQWQQNGSCSPTWTRTAKERIPCLCKALFKCCSQFLGNKFPGNFELTATLAQFHTWLNYQACNYAFWKKKNMENTFGIRHEAHMDMYMHRACHRESPFRVIFLTTFSLGFLPQLNVLFFFNFGRQCPPGLKHLHCLCQELLNKLTWKTPTRPFFRLHIQTYMKTIVEPD